MTDQQIKQSLVTTEKIDASDDKLNADNQYETPKDVEKNNQEQQKQNKPLPNHDQPRAVIPSQPCNPQANLEHMASKYKRDLESMVIKYAKSESENLLNKSKIEELDKKLKRSIKDNESLANRIRILTNDKNSITDTLNAKLAHLTVLEQRNDSLTNAQSVKLKDLEEKCAQLETTNNELLKQIETYKNKEGELLEFSERLSAKQQLLQSELDKALENIPDYRLQYEQAREDNKHLRMQLTECQEKLDKTSAELGEQKNHNAQMQLDIADMELKYRRREDELENEIKVMRRKHQITVKEIHKQIKQIDTKTTSNTQGQKQQTIKS